ncbi:MAG: glycoside hydrolase family 2 TIM barrel-domain containing protein [Bacteroidota bacterium]
MKKINYLLTAFMFLLLSNVITAQLDFDINKYIEDPALFGENKEEPTAILIPYNSISSALEKDVNDARFYSSLNGEWKFNFYSNPLKVPVKFFEVDYNDKDWGNIKVPSVWQMQGYDRLMYRNVPMEFYPYNPPYVPDDINPTGLYRRTFKVPADWDGRRIFIHFDGIHSAAFVWLNGKYIGYHEDGMTPAEFDITQNVQIGVNQLSVMVLRWCDGAYLEDQDMFRFSGIYRNVYIYSKPNTTIRDLFIKTEFDEKYRDAELIIDLSLKNYSGSSSDVKVRYTLFDKNKKEIVNSQSGNLQVEQQLNTTLKQKVVSPNKWSDEKPYLYTLVLELINSENEVIEVVKQRVGFRKLEIKNGIAMLNGMPVYFRGTNRHEHNPDNGRTLTKELMIEDIKLLKQFNFNAVRTSHYPNDPLWYDLCDEYGILLQDEVNAECHYTESGFPGRKEYLGSFMDRFVRMVQRDKNHPSVVIWSTGNECGLDKPHYMMADYVKKFDPTRFLMHQSNWPDGEAPYVDIIGPRYPTPSRLREIGLSTSKPVVMGEYAHAMGNSLGHFDEFWENIYDVPKLQGGFVWDWVDQGLNVKAQFIKDFSPNNIQCGVMGVPEVVNGTDGNAFKFSGLDDWIEVYDDPRLDLRGNNLVIEAMVYPQKFYQENPIVTKASQFGIVQTTVDTLSFYINSYRNNLKVKLPANWYYTWHRIKTVYNGNEMQLFIDEKLYGSKLYNQKIRNGHYPVNIGRDSYRNTDQHLGWISNYIFDDVKIYDNLLNKDDLQKPLLWLKFDEIFSGENYLTYGISPFCHNGMITADRKPQPELWQAKHSMSPVRFYSVDPDHGKFSVVNKYSSTNLNEFYFEWYLYKNGQIEKSDRFELDVDPQSNAEFQLPINLNNTDDFIIELSCKRKYDEPFRAKDFEVNFQQFVIKNRDHKFNISERTNSNIRLEDKKDVIDVTCNGFEYELNKINGNLNLKGENSEIFNDLNSNVWRAPISNEKVDWGRAEAEEWYRMGLNEFTNSIDKILIDSLSDTSSLIVNVKSYTNFPRSSDYIVNEYRYQFHNDGSVEIKHNMIPVGYFFVDWLPCIGLSMKVKNDYKFVNWYGRGPYDNFTDRNTGAKIAIHSIRVDTLELPFAEPQEYGNYTEVGWFELKNENGAGVKITASDDVNFSAVPYFNLDRARYLYQLQKDDFLRVNISYSATGVGDTPNPPMPNYRTYPVAYSNVLLINPMKKD